MQMIPKMDKLDWFFAWFCAGMAANTGKGRGRLNSPAHSYRMVKK
jgi:hypothetical protein